MLPDLDKETSAPLMQELARTFRYNVCIMRDFNYRIDWDSMTGDGDRSSEEFLNVVQDGIFIQLAREPTRRKYFSGEQ